MKSLLFTFLMLLVFWHANGQKPYVDLVKLTYAQVPESKFESTNFTSPIHNTVLVTTIPVLLKDSSVFITGFDYANHNLKLSPYGEPINLNLITLKAGVQFKLKNNWSSRILFTPKIAGDYHSFFNTVQLGGMVLFHNKINSQSQVYFGGYFNTELFGPFTTPILGYYFLSKNKRLEVDLMVPIIGHVDYKIVPKIRFGVDFLTVIRSYQLSKGFYSDFYVHNAFNEYGIYMQYEAFGAQLILQSKLVFTGHDYGLYKDDKRVDFGITGNYFNDNRLRYNPLSESSIGFRFSAIYRFQLNK